MFPKTCDRCNKPSKEYKMSWFNEEMLCKDCQKEEERHPKFEQAKQAELEEVLKGNYNFKGIGL